MTEPYITSDIDINEKSILRKYMDLSKLLDLLYSGSLYFRRADGFADRLEGALFPSLRTIIDDSHSNGEIPYDSDEFYRRAREGSFVSCWSLGSRDNMALWQLYGGIKSSVAVTSTVSKIVNAYESDRSIHIHKVKYVDHKKVKNYVIGAPREVLQYKSDAYTFEKEIRIIAPHTETDKETLGIRVPMDLNTLIRSIVVAPDADVNFVRAVSDVCKKYGLKAPIRRSKLSFVPT